MKWPWQGLPILNRSKRHAEPVPEGHFRLMVLTDEPFPTYIGDRAWCTGEEFWEDRTCKCRHTEDRDG